jgi:hypothetical protein
LGIELEVEDPPEPDDIIYENLEIVKPQEKFNECLLYLYLFIAVILSGIFFSKLKIVSSANSRKYPSYTNCKSIYSNFVVANGTGYYNFDNPDKRKIFREYAEKDMPNLEHFMGGGFYQCYCDKFYDK